MTDIKPKQIWKRKHPENCVDMNVSNSFLTLRKDFDCHPKVWLLKAPDGTEYTEHEEYIKRLFYLDTDVSAELVVKIRELFAELHVPVHYAEPTDTDGWCFHTVNPEILGTVLHKYQYSLQVYLTGDELYINVYQADEPALLYAVERKPYRSVNRHEIDKYSIDQLSSFVREAITNFKTLVRDRIHVYSTYEEYDIV